MAFHLRPTAVFLAPAILLLHPNRVFSAVSGRLTRGNTCSAPHKEDYEVSNSEAVSAEKKEGGALCNVDIMQPNGDKVELHHVPQRLLLSEVISQARSDAQLESVLQQTDSMHPTLVQRFCPLFCEGEENALSVNTTSLRDLVTKKKTVEGSGNAEEGGSAATTASAEEGEEKEPDAEASKVSLFLMPPDIASYKLRDARADEVNWITPEGNHVDIFRPERPRAGRAPVKNDGNTYRNSYNREVGEFRDQPAGPQEVLKKIVIWHSEYVDGIQLFYERVTSDGGLEVVPHQIRGGRSRCIRPTKQVELVLDVERGEYCAEMSGKAGWWMDNICFKTSNGREIKGGRSDGGCQFCFQGRIEGVFGLCDGEFENASVVFLDEE
jgi:hypothetical protein